MCQVSDQIKLCSCKTKNVESLKHYWHIKRKNKDTSYIVSELFMPADIGEENDEINMDIILSKLNMGNIFDMDIKHKNNDILELVFSFKADRERFRNFSPNTGDFLAYAFKYRNGQWKKFDYENWVINFDEVEKGKIVNPFKSKKN